MKREVSECGVKPWGGIYYSQLSNVKEKDVFMRRDALFLILASTNLPLFI